MSATSQDSRQPQPAVKLTIVPATLADIANPFVELTHRHNRPVRGAKFCLGVADESTGLLRGVAIAGRPVSRLLQTGGRWR